MAARLRPHHQDEVRNKIQASQIVNRLVDHGFGNIELTPAQVRSLEIVLKKVLPDLSSIELSGDEENPVEVVTRIELVDGDGSD